MAVIESPTRSNLQMEIDPTHKAARFSLRPLEHKGADDSVLGHYRVAARSGALTGAGIVANAPLFSMRWTDPKSLFVLTFLEAFFVPTVVFTAAQELGLDAILATGFTVSDSAGTTLSLKERANAVRKNMPPSLIGDLRIAAATLLTAGTRTLDQNPFVAGSGLVNVVNAAAGTAYVNPGGGGPIPFGFQWAADLARGEHPIVLAKDEGLIVRNSVAFPAAGVAVLTVNMGFAEVAAY